MSIIDKALKANQTYAKKYDRKLGAHPAPKIVVVTCMDPRLSDLPEILGLPQADIDVVKDALSVFGRVFVIGHKPGMAQTMKLANNFLSATAMAATSEAVAMGVKAGLDAQVMIDVINAGSGRTTASDGKFPQAILPRTFNYGFATGLMLKDVRLCAEEAKRLGVPDKVISVILDQWETTNAEFGAESDLTVIAQMIERRAGVTIGGKKS